MTPDPEPDQHYFVRADQYSFVRQGVPSVFISEGEEAKDPGVDGKKFAEQWIATRYHAGLAASEVEAWGFLRPENFGPKN